MGDHEHGAAAHQVPHRPENPRFRFGVDGARGLVEDHHRTVLQEGAGECDALSLAPRELRAALADLRVITPRQAYDELVRVGGVRGTRRACGRAGTSGCSSRSANARSALARYPWSAVALRLIVFRGSYSWPR